MLEQRLRHYCRNLRCHAKLPEPVENARAAFCCRGCFNSYFRGRCLVCEQAYQRAAEHQKLCRRRQCRRDYNKNPVAYASPWGSQSPDPSRPSAFESTPSQSAHFTGGFWCDKSGRGFGWKAAGEQHHLIDRNGRVAVRLVPGDSDCWWIAHPRTTPELAYPNLDVAKRAAANVALSALPWVLPSRAQLLRDYQASKAVTGRNGAGERYAAAGAAHAERQVVTSAIETEPLVGNDPGPIPQFLLRTLPEAKS